MNLTVSSQCYAKEIDASKFRLDIPLFDYETHIIDKQEVYCLDKANKQKAFQVHMTYQDLGEYVRLQEKQYFKLERKYTSCDFELRACKTVLHDIDVDRRNLYELYEDVVHINAVELKKQKIKFIIVGISGGVLAIAGGFLVGYFIGK